MAVTTTDSLEYTDQVAVPPTMLDPTEQAGRVRVAHFEFSSITGDANSLLNLIKMPAGRVRILKLVAQHSAFATNATLDVGHTGYTGLDGVAVAASENAFVSGYAIDNTTDIDKIVDTVITSRGGFTLQGKFEVAAGSAETLKGWVEYVND